MQLIDQHTKRVMEGCKERALEAGLTFDTESLEYIVTNRDLLQLSPKMMIPTLYDYWVHDVEVLKEKGKYELYPSNPYETVINTRPAISFYNDNNPDWLNVMIFYHVLAHIDFFQNNIFFRHTWDYDFNGKALSDKRLIAQLRSRHGRWVDYIIEFARNMDNLVGYHRQLTDLYRPPVDPARAKLDFYFDVFLQQIQKSTVSEYMKQIELYNTCAREHGPMCDESFLEEVLKKHPEFNAAYDKHRKQNQKPPADIMQYVLENSVMLNKPDNRWMKAVIEVVRNTSMFFQPQIRTKIMNEGWASYWHEKLFLSDDRIKGHEVDFARVNAYVTSLPRVGLNPYALGMRLFQYIEKMADRGAYSLEYQRLHDSEARHDYDRETGEGRGYIFDIRTDFNDFRFISEFIDQDFIDHHKLFVSGRRLSPNRQNWQYYVKSRKAVDYKQMLLDGLYHPPNIVLNDDGSDDGRLRLKHVFEGKPLVADFVGGALLGIEHLWGKPVELLTSEVIPPPQPPPGPQAAQAPETTEIKWRRVIYVMQDRKLSKRVIGQGHA